MTIHHRPPRRAEAPTPTDDRPRRPALLGWTDGAGVARRELRSLPDSAALDGATAILGRGTLLRAATGPVAAEDVRPGDVLAVRGGWAEAVWTAARVPRPSGANPPLLRVAAGAFGAAPVRPILLGGGALVLLDDRRCVPLVGGRLALAPLAALVQSHAVDPLSPPGEVATYGIAVRGQAALDVAGLPVAAAHPAHATMAALHARAAGDLRAMFPMLAEVSGFGPAPIPCLTAAEARMLAGAGPLAVA